MTPRRTFRAVAGLLIACLATVGLVALTPPPSAAAITGADFNPGNIVSDAVFYDYSAMSEGEIQSFLNGKVTSCQSGYTCLKDYRENTGSRAADARCGAYSGGNRTAASIIYSVAQACGINPQVLLVMLQKEQGLVTHTSPSQSRYQIAMGYACPDTAPCDAQYYGFFNQLYSAARQLKNYQANPNSWSYRAGRTNTIYWHPNAGCGTSQVYIENQATAALYIYTPYRPNQAALNNLYGTGDSCSSYGNRNFWRFFHDWFGDPLGGGTLVKTADSPKVYITNGSARYWIPDLDLLQAYAPLGPIRTITSAELNRLAEGPTATRAAHDPTTGEVFFVQSGRKHYVPTCEMLVDYGNSCGVLVSLTRSQLRSFADGPRLSGFVKAPGSSTVFYLAQGKRYPIATWDDAVALAGGGAVNILELPTSFLGTRPQGKTVLGPGLLVKTADNPQIYMIDGLGSRIPVSSFDITGELGIEGFRVVSSSVLGTYSAAKEALTSQLMCGSQAVFGAQGQRWKVTSLNGLKGTTVDPLTCAALPAMNADPVQAYFVKKSGSDRLYAIDGGKKRPVETMDAVFAIAGAEAPLFLTVSAAKLAQIPDGASLLAPGSLVKSPSSSQIYFIDGANKKIPLSSFDVSDEIGVTTWREVPDTTLKSYTVADKPLTTNLVCGDASYVGGGGTLTRVADTKGLPTTTLDPNSCNALPRTSGIAPAFFLKSADSPQLFAVEGGKLRYVPTARALAGLAPQGFALITVSKATLSALPRGADVPDVTDPGNVVKGSAATLYLITGTASKVAVPSFDVMRDWGLTKWSDVSDQELAPFKTVSGGMSVLVQSEGQYYVASQGTFWPLQTKDGFGTKATEVSSAVVKRLTLSSTTATGMLFIKAADDPRVYVVQNGTKRALASWDELVAVNSGQAPFIFTLERGSLELFPTK